VVIPAKDEAPTIGLVVAQVHPHSVGCGGGLVDEILVVDDGSVDDTAAAATAAGGRVLSLEGGSGKGAAMAAGVDASCGDLIVFLDADVENMTPAYLPSLLAPLLLDESVVLVKGAYDRPIDGAATGGGRVTELAARPILRLLFPELAAIRQPLAGETALRRTVLDEVALDEGYRVEIGLLIDVWRRHGLAGIAEVDLGSRAHRNRPLDELGDMATEVLAAALSRAGG
jgi:glucosyl-3-phosphoglycerate synthase